MDRATTAVLHRLRCGPASTVQLQRDLFVTHVAKQILDLRRTGYLITTKRLPNGVAQYRLVSEPVSVASIKAGLRWAFSAPGAPEGAGEGATNGRLASSVLTAGDLSRSERQVSVRQLPDSPAPSGAPGAQFGDATVVAGSHSYQAHPRPQFGDPALLREMRPKGRR